MENNSERDSDCDNDSDCDSDSDSDIVIVIFAISRISRYLSWLSISWQFLSPSVSTYLQQLLDTCLGFSISDSFWLLLPISFYFNHHLTISPSPHLAMSPCHHLFHYRSPPIYLYHLYLYIHLPVINCPL